MARYGRKRAYSSRNRKRTARYTGVRRTKAAVRVPKRKNTARTGARSRALAINTNRAMIRSLRNQMHGAIQCNLCEWTAPILRIYDKYPILFSLDDFTHRETTPVAVNGGAVYQVNFVSGNLTQVSNWTIATGTAGNPYLERWQLDNPGGGKYQMLMNKVMLEVEGRPALSNCRIRVQVFACKSKAFIPTSTASQIQTLPDGLQHLNYMANFSANPNLLPRKYFKTYMDKTIIVNSEPAGTSGTHPTTLNKKYIPITIAPKGGKTVTQAITFPPVQDVVPNPAPGEPSGGWYGPANRGSGEILWCLVSTDEPFDPNEPSPVNLRCSSYRKWRDISGSYY